ncbi:hypothetical protein K491DRAFT_586302 [Lophiostoma macrostomum CBS 122681]|uniref:RanBP2-type domain-containing protein n=1 Tax=Lophiostoma macrostomum CBS 122681 TaxID=1314788 RepID=A0A6A6TS00_9PLEO|nr:hypothetical protein K491DRAFT_586302 [Lophiostoma macrostomum CBS 122681]
MDIPRGHAMLPLNEADFLDFIDNYFKAEYAPIRSFWSTATAEPRQHQRWINMGHELSPLGYRPANAQAQKDLESLDFFVRQKNLDASFVRGIVMRFAKYEVHERLEKRLYECSRLDLMVRKALKEKHLIDALWPSPAPRNIKAELLKQGVQVRQWYGDMFYKYFKHLHSVDNFKLRPEIDAKIKSSGMLMLVPFVDHLVFGTVDPIMPIIAKGAGYANSQAWKQKDRVRSSFGEPDRFEIRFDAPGDLVDTHTRTVTRQCQCLKCGSKRDVAVVISVDPSPGPVRRVASKAAQKYSPGYTMPSTDDSPTPQSEPPDAEDRPASPLQKKQCPRCTFLNHPELTSCEICQGDLPDTTVTKPASPVIRSKPSHVHSSSLPPPATAPALDQQKGKEHLRPSAPNRHSLSSTLFSIFPFSQQQHAEHHPNLPATQPSEPVHTTTTHERDVGNAEVEAPTRKEPSIRTPSPPPAIKSQVEPEPELESEPHTPEPSYPPEMAMMPMTPPPVTPDRPREFPTGMPKSLMDDFVPISPAFPKEQEEEDAGWGEMSKAEARGEDSEDEDEDGGKGGLIDLDAVAMEEMGVWGDKSDDED